MSLYTFFNDVYSWFKGMFTKKSDEPKFTVQDLYSQHC